MKKSKTRIFVSKSISLNLMVYIKGKQHNFLKNVLKEKFNNGKSIIETLVPLRYSNTKWGVFVGPRGSLT